MFQRAKRERGQAIVEFGVIGVVFLMLTVGLIDVGRAFFQYNELGALAAYGARWGSVVGGTCALPDAKSTSDWCNQFGVAGTNRFWTQTGNEPDAPMTFGGKCPAFKGTPTNVAPTDFYTMQPFVGTPTIVGAIAQKYDTNASSANVVTGNSALGLDRNKVFVCIATTNGGSGLEREPRLGDTITVTVGYKFIAASGLFGKQLAFDLSATSTYKMEY
jgi:hypothetical protein